VIDISITNVFERYELKYIITKEQKNAVLKALEPYMQMDQYGKTTIRNIYFDTENFRLIRHSIEKPVYREKLRIRSYDKVKNDDCVYVEIKKKFEDVVYKRRIALPYSKAMPWLCGKSTIDDTSQIANEIDYFISYYKDLKPEVYISYEREAYYMRDGSDFKVTFDENILWREDNLSLEKDAYGTPILESGHMIMEIKTAKAIPLWLTAVLTKEHICKQPFSKYGKAYEELVNVYI